MVRKITNALLIATMVVTMLAVIPAGAAPIVGDGPPPAPDTGEDFQPLEIERVKPIDQPNPIAYIQAQKRMRLLAEGKYAEAAAFAQTGTTKVLVLLVEFAGTDTFTWNPGDEWDPLGISDPSEYTGTVGDCSAIITETQTFTYTGPMHNELPRPISPDDRSGDSIWTEDFSSQWFEDFMFGQGVVFSYTMQDGTPVHEDFTGQSVTDYYMDMSNGVFTVTGDVVGWLEMPHSTWYYDADECPGARSGASVQRGGVIPGAGSTKTLVVDALDAVNEKIDLGELPDFDWTDYDGDGDGIIDSLWIVHAGYGEEDSTTLLNRSDYGEAAVWSHSSAVTPYEVDPVNGISAYSYIMMPENGGMAVFAHEFGHNIGAIDLYSYGDGETSAGFWTLMSDSWVDYPVGFGVNSFDPYHLDQYWGWLDDTMMTITDTSKVYTFTLGQASQTPEGAYQAAKIELPDGVIDLAVPVWSGSYYWWGGKADQTNGMMTTTDAISIPVGVTTATLSFDMAYNIEDEWDFLWVQVSPDLGTTWETLTNTNTQCVHDPNWIGEINGFPADLCAANIGGYYGHNANFPDPDPEEFDLSAYAGEELLVRFWYMTDWGTTYDGPFVDDVAVSIDDTPVFTDDAETDSGKWAYAPPWGRSDGTQVFDQNFYFQWRNTTETGGYDMALGDERWRFGPANSGLIAWYNNNFYNDNEIYAYMDTYPSIGPKGAMLVFDSHPDPYRDPELIYSDGLSNEYANVTNRGMVRDAAFNRDLMTPDFDMQPPYVVTDTMFTGRPGEHAWHDALGYYPGLELTKISSTSTNRYWITRDWDASTVMPATSSYGIKAPADYPAGYTAFPDPLWGYNNGWYFLSAIIGPVPTSSGNPGEGNAQYGWHVEVLDEAADMTSATVRVWNSMDAVDAKLMSPSTAKTGEYVDYTLHVKNAGSNNSFLACVPLDNEVVSYVEGSASHTPLFLESCPESASAALAQATAANPAALAWLLPNMTSGAEENITFQLMAVDGGQSYDGDVMIFDANGELYASKITGTLEIPMRTLYLPIVEQ